MTTQLETLQLIALNLEKIWDKLCRIEELINGGVIVDIPPFFNQYGDLAESHEITLVEGNPDDPDVASGMFALNDMYSAFILALKVYANRKDEPWQKPPDPAPDPGPDPAPDPGPDPAPDPGPDPAPDPNPDPGDNF